MCFPKMHIHDQLPKKYQGIKCKDIPYDSEAGKKEGKAYTDASNKETNNLGWAHTKPQDWFNIWIWCGVVQHAGRLCSVRAVAHIPAAWDPALCSTCSMLAGSLARSREALNVHVASSQGCIMHDPLSLSLCCVKYSCRGDW